jgi:hypothetical protein
MLELGRGKVGEGVRDGVTFVPETPGSYISVPHFSIQYWLRVYNIYYRIGNYIRAIKKAYYTGRPGRIIYSSSL